MHTQPDDTNSAQWEAINYDGGHLLIVAGPGTGKTHTLTYRIANVAQSIDEGVLAITFTKKAAEEMRARVKARVNDESGYIFIGTFHQYCLGLLQTEGSRLGLPDDICLIDDETAIEIGKKLWPDETASQRRRRLADISRWKNSRLHQTIPEDVQLYNAELHERNLIDYDDVLLETLRLFDEFQPVLEDQRATFPYVFVDEYQDINSVQYELLKYLVGEDGCLTAIGDPNQAVYGFRGANVEYFHAFQKDFEGAHVVSLQDNYRSGENILSASAQVLNNKGEIFVPELTANIYSQGRLTVHQAPTEKAEAEYVVHSVEKLIGGTSMFSQDSGRVGSEEEAAVSFEDIAVLYRLHSQANALKQAFDRSGIPYHVVEREAEKCDTPGPGYDQELSFESGKVSLMSLHASKGLEFDVVFMVGCEEGLMPLNVCSMKSEVDEERRLFYVGMTRAKRFLFCTSAEKRMLFGQSFNNNVSPFLAVIEEQLKHIEKPAKRPKKKHDQQMDLFTK